MWSDLSKDKVRRLEASASIMEFCKEPRGFNEVVKFAERRHIYSRMKVREVLSKLVDRGLVQLQKGNQGRPDSYQTTEEGTKEITNISQYRQGAVTGPILTGEMEVTVTLAKSRESSLVGDVIREMEVEALRGDVQKQKTLGTLIGSLIKAYSLAQLTDSSVARGAFVQSEGRFTLVTFFSKKESEQILDMINSGRFTKGSEIQHISQLIHNIGNRGLQSFFLEQKRTSFEPNSFTLTNMLLALDKDSVFANGLADVDKLEDKVKIWKQIRDGADTQIKILSSELES